MDGKVIDFLEGLKSLVETDQKLFSNPQSSPLTQHPFVSESKWLYEPCQGEGIKNLDRVHLWALGATVVSILTGEHFVEALYGPESCTPWKMSDLWTKEAGQMAEKL